MDHPKLDLTTKYGRNIGQLRVATCVEMVVNTEFRLRKKQHKLDGPQLFTKLCRKDSLGVFMRRYAPCVQRDALVHELVFSSFA